MCVCGIFGVSIADLACSVSGDSTHILFSGDSACILQIVYFQISLVQLVVTHLASYKLLLKLCKHVDDHQDSSSRFFEISLQGTRLVHPCLVL